MEFKKRNNNLPRVYLPEKGDIFAIDIMTLDFFHFKQICEQFMPIRIEEKKIPIKKWLPFIKKKRRYVVCEFTGNETQISAVER